MYNLWQHSFSYAGKHEQCHPDRIIVGFLKRKYRRRCGALLRPEVLKNLSQPCHNIVLKEVDENGSFTIRNTVNSKPRFPDSGSFSPPDFLTCTGKMPARLCHIKSICFFKIFLLCWNPNPKQIVQTTERSKVQCLLSLMCRQIERRQLRNRRAGISGLSKQPFLSWSQLISSHIPVNFQRRSTPNTSCSSWFYSKIFVTNTTGNLSKMSEIWREFRRSLISP